MRLKSVVKYNISEMKNSILIFYGIMVAVVVLLGISFVGISSNSTTSFVGGAEMASVIFLFVVGLNSFKQNYLFLSANGVTRKAQFYGFLISSLTIVVVMAAIDLVYGRILSQFADYRSMFAQTYNELDIVTFNLLDTLASFLWSSALYLFAIVLGYFITTLYYRMSKLLKVIVSVGVPAIFMIALPTVDALVTDGKISKWISDMSQLLWGLKNGNNPYIAVMSLIAGTIILASLAFLLVKRAPVKE